MVAKRLTTLKHRLQKILLKMVIGRTPLKSREHKSNCNARLAERYFAWGCFQKRGTPGKSPNSAGG
jgi:hypothetical protein